MQSISLVSTRLRHFNKVTKYGLDKVLLIAFSNYMFVVINIRNAILF